MRRARGRSFTSRARARSRRFRGATRGIPSAPNGHQLPAWEPVLKGERIETLARLHEVDDGQPHQGGDDRVDGRGAELLAHLGADDVHALDLETGEVTSVQEPLDGLGAEPRPPGQPLDLGGVRQEAHGLE